MLTEQEILQACTDAPLSGDGRSTLVAFGRAIEAKLLQKLRPVEPLAAIGALERAAQQMEAHRDRIAQADPTDYSAIYPAGDAEQLRQLLETVTRMGVGA